MRRLRNGRVSLNQHGWGGWGLHGFARRRYTDEEMVNGESQVDEDLLSGLVKHGAKYVETKDLFRQAVLVWRIPEGTIVSRTNIRLEEFMSSAARNCKGALDVIDKIDSLVPEQDPHLFTALKKYVEDACEAIRVVDSELKTKKSGLAELLSEFSDHVSQDRITWKNPIGRRGVIAHQHPHRRRIRESTTKPREISIHSISCYRESSLCR